MYNTGDQVDIVEEHCTGRPATASVELLADGSFYFTIDSAGSGYSHEVPPTVAVNGTWAGRAGAVAPSLTGVVAAGGLSEVTVDCLLNARGNGCMKTVGFGLPGAYEYTQGRLAFGTNYSSVRHGQRWQCGQGWRCHTAGRVGRAGPIRRQSEGSRPLCSLARRDHCTSRLREMPVGKGPPKRTDQTDVFPRCRI